MINVETNNLAIVEPLKPGSTTLILEIGDNRGVNILITKSEFSHSRFCKGMIVFKRRPILASTDKVTVFNLGSLVTHQADTSFIKIANSKFNNLNFGKVLTTLSLLIGTTLPIADLNTISYPTFDNHGSVLNLQGFPGGVKVAESTFENNLIYIPDIYPSKRSSSDEIETLENYKNKYTGQIKTTRCNTSFEKKRFFSNYLTSLTEQASQELSSLEKYSPIYIGF